jgi:2'-5' RNA ligase
VDVMSVKLRRSNILDPIHAELDPRVWDNPAATKPILKPLHAHWIKKQVYETLEKAGYTDIEKWLTLVLTGSLTTYQYSEESDVDISLFVDSKVFPEWSRAEMIALMVDKLDGTTMPGTPFPLQDFVVGEGIKPTDLYKPGLRSGYNIDQGHWLVPPEHDRVHDVKAEQGGFYAWALQMADKMERLLRYEPDQAIEFWHSIHKKRQRDMAKGKGDFAESNIIYKMLANRGLFPQISGVSGEYIAKTAASDWFAPSYMVPDETKHAIHEWAHTLPWPLGSRMAPPDRYHVTGVYSPSGFGDPSHHDWAESHSGLTYPVQTTGVESFSPPKVGEQAPVVMRVHHPQLEADTERLMDEAQQRGLPVSRFPGGYKPHITLGYSPTPLEVEHPNMNFKVGPLRDLHSYYDELKQQREGKTSVQTPMGFQTMFHVSPRKNRESILEHGLEGHEQGRREESPWDYTWPQPPGNYLFDNLDDARAYTHTMHQQINPREPGEYGHDNEDYEEDRYEYPDPPEGFEDWPEEEQEAWHDEAEPVERNDDPNGMDIYSVQAHGLPIAPDPEALVSQKAHDNDWDLGRIHDEQERLRAEETGRGYDPDSPNEELGGYHGTEPKRYYVPTAVQPSRLALEEHHPSWGLTPEHSEEAHEETNDKEIPTPWAKIPFTERPVPGHEAKIAGNPQVAKFVYHPNSNRLLLGQMGREEGEHSTHSELAHHPIWEDVLPKEMAFGDINENGYVTTHARPQISLDHDDMNQYQKQYMTEEALRRAVPGAQFTNPTKKLNPAWELPSDPEVTYMGKPPVVTPRNEPEERWQFKASNPVAHKVYDETMQMGGSTRDLYGNGPTARYGFAPDLATQTPIPEDQFSPQAVEDFIARFKDRLHEPGKYVGAWKHEGNIVLDVTEGHDDHDEAYQRAWNGHQKSMWDSVANQEVPVRGLDYEQPLTAQ